MLSSLGHFKQVLKKEMSQVNPDPDDKNKQVNPDPED
jgi:hypothetical protein